MNCPLHELPITGVLLYLWIFPLVISSTGEAAEMCGAWLGQYEYKGEHNGAPYHVQTGDDVVTREAKNAWRVGDELGSTKDVLYHPPTGDTDTPPLSGWQWYDKYGDKHYDDPTLVIAPGPLSPTHTIALQAEAAFYPHFLGTFTKTER